MFQQDSFGHTPYQYAPRWDIQVERHPDKLPSVSGFFHTDHQAGFHDTWAFGVMRLGVLVFRPTANGIGLSIFTSNQIRFDDLPLDATGTL